MILRQYKKTGLCLLMAAELFFLIMSGYHDLTSSFSTTLCEFEEVLPKGIFRLTGEVNVTAASEEENVSHSVLKAECPENLFAMDAEEIPLSPGYQHLDDLFYTHDRDLKVRVHTDIGEGERVVIRDFSVRYLPFRTFSYHLICAGFGFVCLDLLILCLSLWKEKIRNRMAERGREYLFDLLILAAAVFPLFTGLLLTNGGQDSGFHMMRIRGIADGILSGQFPVRIMPGVLWGHGYALGVYYGDIFLYPFALLYLLGIKLRNAYKAYIIAVTVVTYAIGKRSFRGICELLGCKAEKMGIPLWSVLSAVYLLGIYRLSDVYTRGAVGEFTALAFLPAILYGLYEVCSEKKEKASSGWVWLGIGMSGIILSHVISTLMMIEFGILFLILFFRRLLKKQILLELLKAVLVTLLICAGFLVPFLDYYLGLDIWGQSSGDQMIIGVRVALPQLFSLLCNPVGEANWHGMTGEMSQGVGLSMAFVLVAALVMLCKGAYGKRSRVVGVELILLAVSVFLASELFPAWMIYRRFPGLYRIWAMVQFGFRYLEVAVIVLMAVLTETIAATYRSEEGKIRTAGYGLTVAVVLVTMFQAVLFLSEFMLEAQGQKALNIHDYKWGYEYMPDGSSPEHLRYHQEVISSSETLICQEMEQSGLRMDLKVENNGEEAYLLIPRIWYPGYRAEKTSGSPVTVEKGEMAMVKVVIPESCRTEITVDYREPFYWRFAELCSLTAWIILGLWIRKQAIRRNGSN